MKKTKILKIFNYISTALFGLSVGLCVYFAPALLSTATAIFSLTSIVLSYFLSKHLKKEAITLLEAQFDHEKDNLINNINP